MAYEKKPPIDLPAHTPGIKQGNERGNYERQRGHKPDGTSTAERSTGVNPQYEEPIDPSMPNLSPG
ncbi:MAG TPA: hypothetical protein VGC49_03350 [Solirubrobacterales bacterium]|jgi:hypothetical protein